MMICIDIHVFIGLSLSVGIYPSEGRFEGTEKERTSRVELELSVSAQYSVSCQRSIHMMCLRISAIIPYLNIHTVIRYHNNEHNECL
jgi:hypothetical protein